MRKYFIAAACFALIASACTSGGGTTRTILVDYASDEFATFVLSNFPARIEAHPGDTLQVRQTWTGEPHTFTGGTLFNDKIAKAGDWFTFFDAFGGMQSAGVPLPDPDNPGDATVADFVRAANGSKDEATKKKLFDSYSALRRTYPKLPAIDESSTMPFGDLAKIVNDESTKAVGNFPEALGDNFKVNQTAGAPCYLRRGPLPKDDNKGCAKRNRVQPKFDGTQAFYNSGVIPYSGPQGNTFTVPLAKDVKPGNYFFFCLVHGPEQQTEVVVRPSSKSIPDQQTISRQAQREIKTFTAPLLKQWRDAKDGTFSLGEDSITGPFAGLIGAGRSAINEFVPKRLTAKVNEPVTWKMMGAEHTITFNPPKYFPPIEFRRDGSVRFNPKLSPPAGGAKAFPEQHQEGPPTGPIKFDGGTYDGTGFWSSGLIGSEPYIEYTMRVSKPGRYQFACLLHPPMIGTLVVQP